MKNAARATYTSTNGGALYFVGFIGALVYYVDVANGFWQVVVAFLKAFVWPAFLTHDLLRFIN
jgi:hypothetical protein